MLVSFPNDRERLAPITLAAEKPIAQLIIDAPMSEAAIFEPLADSFFRFRRAQAVEKFRINHSTIIADVADRFDIIRRLNYFLDRQLELVRKFQVTLIVTRNSHDCAGPVTGEHVVGDPDRNALLVHRIDCI